MNPGFGVAQRTDTPDDANEMAVEPPTKLKARVWLVGWVEDTVVVVAPVVGTVVVGAVVLVGVVMGVVG